jgi:lauroyl/myristoyl acyltransferase
MTERLYRCIVTLSRKLGWWVFLTYLWIVAAGFFVLFPCRLAACVRFYRVLFPDKRWLYPIQCAWKQYHHFTSIFLDKFLIEESVDISYTSDGLEYLQEALYQKTGGIILMSHMGNWEMAAHLLKKNNPNIRMLLYMGKRQKEQMERIQRENLFRSGIKIIALDPEGNAPYEIIDGIHFIRTGGIVSLTGDVVWHKDQKTVPVRFLDHEAKLPETPHALALLTGSPLFMLFAFRTGHGRYHFSLSPPIRIRTASRSERPEAVRKSAQKYASILEEAVRRYPLQWYHFGHFLGNRLK